MAQNKLGNTMFNEDFMKMFSNGMSSVPFDIQSFMETQRKNFQAFTEAQQLAIEGLQAVAQRQTEIISQIVEDNSKLAKEIMAEGTPEEKVAKQADLVKKSYEKSIVNYKELADMVAESNQQASEIINKRVTASLNEIKASVEKGKKTPANTSKAA